MTAPVVARLRAAAASIPDEGATMRTLAQAHGPDSHATLLLLMSVPCMLPVPGVGTMLGFGLLALAVAIWRGSDAAALPPRVAEFQLSRRWAQRVLLLMASAYAMAGRYSRARAHQFARAHRRPWFAAIIGLLGFVIILPIPFGNVVPAVAMTLMGLGLVFRDGIAILLGLATGVFALVATSAAVLLAYLWGTEWISRLL